MSVIGTIVLSIGIVFLGTTLGSAAVFFLKKKPGDRFQAVAMGLASGVMLAAAFFGLLNPSIEEAQATLDPSLSWLPPLGGLALGALLLYLIDKVVPHLHVGASKAEGPAAPHLKEEFKFFLAVAIHNLPEGLVTGFSCGLALSAYQAGNTEGALAFATSALVLSVGIAIQDLPEGMAVSVPLYIDGMSRGKAFGYGVLSGAVEPVAAILGMFLSTFLSSAMPWFLSFGAGAMLYVIVEDLVPHVSKKGVEHFGLAAFMIGFGFMMLMELLL